MEILFLGERYVDPKEHIIFQILVHDGTESTKKLLFKFSLLGEYC